MSETRIAWNGFDVRVDDLGEGEPALLLHSSGLSADQWRRTSDVLVRSGFRVVAPDLLGTGRSTPWPEGEPFRFENDVEVVRLLLERVASPAHLVGHSYGGLIALRGALLRPALVRSIALYDPVAFGVLDPERDAAGLADLRGLRFTWGDTAAQHEEWLESFFGYWGGAGAWSRLRDTARAEFMRVGWVVYEGARTLVDDETRASAYAGLRVPTLLMTGEASPAAARGVIARLGEAIPGARVERFEGAGHMGPMTHVARFNELLTAHLRAASA